MNTRDAQLLDRLPCGWLSLDSRGTVLAVNATLCRLLEAEPAALIGRPFDSLLSRPSRVLYQSYLQPLLRLHGRVEEFALAFEPAPARTVDALLYSVPGEPGPDASGPDASTELVVASIRKRRGIEDEMLRIKRAADHAPGMIFQLMQLADGSCHFPYTSEAVRRMYGVSSQQVSQSAEQLLGLLSEATRAELARGLRDAARTERDWHAVFEVSLRGGAARWHEVNATPRRLAHGVTLWHGHCADITEQRALELAMADRAALEKVHEARSEFLARVSHELRTPLNAILGFAHLLATDRADNLSAAQHDRLAVLSASGQHLLALVNEVLELTSIESGRLQVELQAVELAPALQAALHAVSLQAEEARVRLLPTHCPEGLQVRSNAQRLHQVLVNLLSNAIKYNRSEGTVGLLARAEGEQVLLEVADTGQGMSAAQRESLFQPFNRLGAEHTGVRGHGLGLVISRHLLGLMGAALSVTSVPGQGSVFTIAMPIEANRPVAPPQASPAAAGAAEAPRATPAVASPLATGRVLYVEDDEVNRILMAAVLGMRPQIAMDIATTGAQAIELVRTGRHDLLLIDMHLPDTDGIDLLAALRRMPGLPAVPAIMVSAGAREQDVDRALACGFAAYWTKPLDIERVLAALDAFLGSGQAKA